MRSSGKLRIDVPSDTCRRLLRSAVDSDGAGRATDASLWGSLMFGGIDDVDVEAVTAAFGKIEVAASGPWNCWSAPAS